MTIHIDYDREENKIELILESQGNVIRTLEQITGKNEKEKLNVPRFPHLHILQSKNFKFPAFFDKIVKKGLSLLLVGIEPQSPGWQVTILATIPQSPAVWFDEVSWTYLF